MTLQYVEEWLDLTGPKRPDIMWLPVEMSQTPLQLLDFVEPRDVSFLFCFSHLPVTWSSVKVNSTASKRSLMLFFKVSGQVFLPPKYSDRERFRERDKITGGTG